MDVKEPAVSYSNKKYTIEEYLETERASHENHEYYRGEVFAMSDLKVPHGIISGNTFLALVNQLKGNWELKEYKSIDNSFTLNSIQAMLELKEIYEGTKFLNSAL
jgi:hypothetical protein